MKKKVTILALLLLVAALATGCAKPQMEIAVKKIDLFALSHVDGHIYEVIEHETIMSGGEIWTDYEINGVVYREYQ